MLTFIRKRMIENFYYYDDIFTLVRKNHFKKIL